MKPGIYRHRTTGRLVLLTKYTAGLCYLSDGSAWNYWEFSTAFVWEHEQEVGSMKKRQTPDFSGVFLAGGVLRNNGHDRALVWELSKRQKPDDCQDLGISCMEARHIWNELWEREGFLGQKNHAAMRKWALEQEVAS